MRCNPRDRAEFIHWFMKYAPLTLETSFGSLHNAAKRLMRLASTHVRIDTELTNGYKDSRGNWDAVRTAQSVAKRNRIDTQMESIAPIIYGALTVSVRMGNREFYIPVSQ